MKNLQGQVGVVTGAASGIGRELAIECAREGMRTVIADVDMRGLETTQRQLADFSAESLIVECDVSNAQAVESLAEQAWEKFGGAHLLFNNAGVSPAGLMWKSTAEDWQWVLGVNVMGIVHGIQSFVPRMLESKSPCHIVNTASVAGLVSSAVGGVSAYAVSKHAAVAISECLTLELQDVKADIGVSVLCPAHVDTNLGESDRNRPATLAKTNPDSEFYLNPIRAALKTSSLSTNRIARITLDAVKTGQFYVLTHTEFNAGIRARMQDILEGRTPTARPLRA